jgi:hypothetical protein
MRAVRPGSPLDHCPTGSYRILEGNIAADLLPVCSSTRRITNIELLRLHRLHVQVPRIAECEGIATNPNSRSALQLRPCRLGSNQMFWTGVS